MKDSDRKNIDLYLSYKLLFLTTPVLYGLILWKFFEWYHFSLSTQLILFLLPVIVSFFIKTKSKDIPNNTQHILQTMSFYSIPFFLAVNASFDFSKPSSKGYLITDKTSPIEEKQDSEGYYKITDYQFKVIPKEKMNTVQIKKYEIPASKIKLAKYKKDYEYLRSYYFKEYPKPTTVHVNRKTYHQFGKGDFLDIETYPGLFGIKWTYYHWKLND
ncbi:hypothetical protein [Chryseobacterium lathyri]|uniref:Uncharacterized protein n=1 Tax=Chryseobacterium lathyri TaxID=395933 RepID=A0ABT9SK60_9FLAO|nr:hypothetical protein [Chryseobacterium lathyri]MDP9959810.1 hypothetical protein [Chryseobacterium lathyri]